MVRNSKGRCVFPDDCPCSFGEREYDQGSVTSVGCNEWCIMKDYYFIGFFNVQFALLFHEKEENKSLDCSKKIIAICS
jgi:hypothetical protein